jgi:hypothetical protein
VVLEVISRLRACWVTHSAVGWAVIPARCTRPVPCSMTNSTCRRRKNTVSTWQKSAARMVLARASGNARQVCPARPGAGSMPASLRICHTVDGASLWPGPASSPWMRRYPQPGLSRAISRTSARTARAVRGRPGARRG